MLRLHSSNVVRAERELVGLADGDRVAGFVAVYLLGELVLVGTIDFLRWFDSQEIRPFSFFGSLERDRRASARYSFAWMLIAAFMGMLASSSCRSLSCPVLPASGTNLRGGDRYRPRILIQVRGPRVFLVQVIKHLEAKTKFANKHEA